MSIIDFPSEGDIGVDVRPKRYDIEIYQGDTFTFTMTFLDGATPVDVTGWTAQAQIKKMDNTPGETPNLGITVGTTDGKITVDLTDTETAALAGTTDYKYDIQVSDGTSKRTYIGGKITVTEDVTEWV
jgi:hypothetical protein